MKAIYFNHKWENLHGYETNLVKLIYYDFDSGYSEQYRSYGNYRICTILEGEKIVQIDDNKFNYDKDEYLLLSPNSKVEMNMPVKTKALVLELSDDLIDSVNKKIFFDRDFSNSLRPEKFVHNKMDRHIKEAMESIKESFDRSKGDRNFFIDLAAQKLTYDLLKDDKNYLFMTSTEGADAMAKVPEIIKNCREKVTVTSVALMLNMSISSFSNSFKAYYGVTPNQYITSYKMDRAKELLKTETVGEVSFELGYDNVSHFITLFKKSCNLTPKQYQLINYNNHLKSGIR